MDKLSLSLECPICYQTLVDPRILPCAHTFCINCIISMCHGVDDTRCPVCRAIAIVPINGGRGFPTNYLVANLLEQIQAATNAKISSRLCSGVHAAMEVALYCVTCSEMICHKCAYDNHPKRRHKCISIEEASKNIRSQLLKSDSTSEREEVVTAKTQLYEQQADIELHSLSTTDEIKQFYDGIATYLQRRKNAMLRAVDACNSIQQHAINKKLEEAQDKIQEFEDRDEMITSLLRLEDVELLSKMKNQQGFHNIAIPVLSVPTHLVRFTTMDNARAYIDKICSLQSDRNGSLEEMEIDEGVRGVVEMRDPFESNTNINIIIQNNYNNDNNESNSTRKISSLGSEIEYELDELDQLEHELEQELATQNNSIISNNAMSDNHTNNNDNEENENGENDETDENENEEYTNQNENENESEQDGLQNNDYSENDNIEHENYSDMFSYNSKDNNNEQIESDDESYHTARLTPSLLPSSNDTDYDDDYYSPPFPSFSSSHSRSPSALVSSSSSSSSRIEGDYSRSSAVLRRLPSYSSTTHYPSYDFNSSHSSSSSSNSNTLREKSNYWLSKIWRQ